MEKNVDNRQVIVIDKIDSPYFEQGILIVKKNVVCESDKIVNEANRIVLKYIAKFGGDFSDKKNSKKGLAFAVGLSLVATLICIILGLTLQ